MSRIFARGASERPSMRRSARDTERASPPRRYGALGAAASKSPVGQMSDAPIRAAQREEQHSAADAAITRKRHAAAGGVGARLLDTTCVIAGPVTGCKTVA